MICFLKDCFFGRLRPQYSLCAYLKMCVAIEGYGNANLYLASRDRCHLMRDEHTRSLDNIDGTSKCVDIINLIIKHACQPSVIRTESPSFLHR